MHLNNSTAFFTTQIAVVAIRMADVKSDATVGRSNEFPKWPTLSGDDDTFQNGLPGSAYLYLKDCANLAGGKFTQPLRDKFALQSYSEVGMMHRLSGKADRASRLLAYC